MPFSATELTNIYEVLGVPQKTAASVVWSMLGFFGPAADSFDIEPIKTLIDAATTAASATQIVAVQTHLTRWATIKPYGVSRLIQAGTAKGVVTDYEQERRNIRLGIGTILGIAVPSNGFWAEARKRQGARIIR